MNQKKFEKLAKQLNISAWVYFQNHENGETRGSIVLVRTRRDGRGRPIPRTRHYHCDPTEYLRKDGTVNVGKLLYSLFVSYTEFNRFATCEEYFAYYWQPKQGLSHLADQWVENKWNARLFESFMSRSLAAELLANAA